MSKVMLSYASARVRVRIRRMLDRRDFERFLGMEVNQITRSLQERDEYQSEIDELGVKYSGAALLEYALSLNLANRLTGLLDMLEGSLRDEVEAYLRRFDVRNVKTLVRGKVYGADGEDVREQLVPAAEFSQEELYGFVEMRFPEFFEALSSTRYGEVLGVLEEAFEEDGRIGQEALSRFEDEVEKLYYRELLEVGRESDVFTRLVRAEIDFVNAFTLLRFAKAPMVEGVPEGVEELLVPGGLELDDSVVQRMLGCEGFEEMLDVLRGTGMHGISKDVESIGDLETYLRNAMVDEFRMRMHMEPLSAAPVVTYILMKQREVHRIRTIARAREDGLPEETIRGLVGM